MISESAGTFPAAAELYRLLEAPIAALDCGKKCGPLNERGAPFCCDTGHCVPAAYPEEWSYLKVNTNLWHRWKGPDKDVRQELEAQVQDGQVLIECLGFQHCQREFRSLDCRTFPFYPYLDSSGDFLGLGILFEYRDRCWVLSNLEVVTDRYREQFVRTFDYLFREAPAVCTHYREFSARVREHALGADRKLILLHRCGTNFRVDPGSEKPENVRGGEFPAFEPYLTLRSLPFPEERT